MQLEQEVQNRLPKEVSDKVFSLFLLDFFVVVLCFHFCFSQMMLSTLLQNDDCNLFSCEAKETKEGTFLQNSSVEQFCTTLLDNKQTAKGKELSKSKEQRALGNNIRLYIRRQEEHSSHYLLLDISKVFPRHVEGVRTT